jgi:hypothetical protein
MWSLHDDVKRAISIDTEGCASEAKRQSNLKEEQHEEGSHAEGMSSEEYESKEYEHFRAEDSIFLHLEGVKRETLTLA